MSNYILGSSGVKKKLDETPRLRKPPPEVCVCVCVCLLCGNPIGIARFQLNDQRLPDFGGLGLGLKKTSGPNLQDQRWRRIIRG